MVVDEGDCWKLVFSRKGLNRDNLSDCVAHYFTNCRQPVLSGGLIPLKHDEFIKNFNSDADELHEGIY